MKKRLPQRKFSGQDAPMAFSARTGEHCPVNGWWVSTSGEGASRFIAEGSLMPAELGKSAIWTLAASDFRLRKPQYTHPAV